MKLLPALAIALLATAASGRQDMGYPPSAAYSQSSPAYGQPYPDAANNRGDRDDRRDDHRAEATFFVDDNFRGRGVTLDRGIRRLGPTGMEDRISSIGIRSGVWLVCSDDDFRGRCVTLDRSVARLSDIGLDDSISSIRPLRGRTR